VTLAVNCNINNRQQQLNEVRGLSKRLINQIHSITFNNNIYHGKAISFHRVGVTNTVKYCSVERQLVQTKQNNR
jgi:hypothetical protein